MIWKRHADEVEVELKYHDRQSIRIWHYCPLAYFVFKHCGLQSRMSNASGDELSTFEVWAVGATLFVFAVYHLNMYVIKPQFLNGKMPFTIHMVNSEMWIRKHSEAADSPTTVLAIQTIRNTLTVGVFVGGNAIKIGFEFANDFKDLEGARWRLRSVILMGMLFGSFVCWANVVRLGSTLGYMIGTMQYSEKLRMEAFAHERRRAAVSDLDSDAESAVNVSDSHTKKRKSTGRKKKAPTIERIASGEITPEDIPDIYKEGSHMVQSMTMFFSLGFRLMFISIPYAFYAAGPLALVISAGCLMIFLPFYDYAQR